MKLAEIGVGVYFFIFFELILVAEVSFAFCFLSNAYVHVYGIQILLVVGPFVVPV